MLNFDVPDLYVKDYKNVFPGKQEALLSALKSAEKACGKDTPIKTKKCKPPPKKHCVSVRSFRNKESIFKVPEVPFRVGNIRRAMFSKPTVRRGNWIKYDLSNVSDDDMSESSNTRAAFSFLKELEDRKNKSEENEEVNPENFKPLFQRRSRDSVGNDRRANFQSTRKLASTGETEPTSAARNRSNVPAKSTIKLNHLNVDIDAE